MYFTYSQQALDYLRRKDCRLREVIDRIGPIRREAEPDLFSSVVHSIAGQQISMKAQETVWRRLQSAAGIMDPPHLLMLSTEALQKCGLSQRKTEYIRAFARRMEAGEFSREILEKMDDSQAIRKLTTLNGVGIWTAEMTLLFCLQRQDILSYNDLGIINGLKILYHHREISRVRFERYRRRFSPYGSVAGFYLWAVNAGY